MRATSRRRIKASEEQWREVFDEWCSSGLSDDVFCKRENYCIDLFRLMRKQLKLDQKKQSSAIDAGPLEEAEQQAPNPFVPIRLVSAEPNPKKLEPTTAEQSISILVPGGAVIKVDGCDVHFITELYSSLKCEVQPC